MTTTVFPRAKSTPAVIASWWPEIAGERQDAVLGVLLREIAQQLHRPVFGSVVHEDDLRLELELGKELLKPLVELGDDLLFVVDRKNEAERRPAH